MKLVKNYEKQLNKLRTDIYCLLNRRVFKLLYNIIINKVLKHILTEYKKIKKLNKKKLNNAKELCCLLTYNIIA